MERGAAQAIEETAAAAEEGEVAVAAEGVGGAFGYLGGLAAATPDVCPRMRGPPKKNWPRKKRMASWARQQQQINGGRGRRRPACTGADGAVVLNLRRGSGACALLSQGQQPSHPRRARLMAATAGVGAAATAGLAVGLAGGAASGLACGEHALPASAGSKDAAVQNTYIPRSETDLPASSPVTESKKSFHNPVSALPGRNRRDGSFRVSATRRLIFPRPRRIAPLPRRLIFQVQNGSFHLEARNHRDGSFRLQPGERHYLEDLFPGPRWIFQPPAPFSESKKSPKRQIPETDHCGETDHRRDGPAR